MNALVELLLSNALAATMLAVLVAAACVVIRRPAVRNALWLVVLVRLFLPPVWNVPLLEEYGALSAEYRALADVAAEMQLAAQPLADAPGATDELFALDDPILLAGDFDAIGSPTESFEETPAAVSSLPSPVPAPLAEKVSHSVLSPQSSVLLLWLAGAFLILALAAVRVARFHRALRQDAIRAPAALQEQAAEVARRLGVRSVPEVWLVAGRVPPMLWKPGPQRRGARILLPAALMLRLGEDERAALLAHELAHLRRGDPWVRWLELLAQALYWWHPLLGWIRRRVRES